MPRVYIADGRPEERSALRRLLLDLDLEMAGESADWSTTLTQAPSSEADMLLVDWDLLPSLPDGSLQELRRLCPAALVIVLINNLDGSQLAAQAVGADAFISKNEMAGRVVERLRFLAASTPAG